MKKKETTKTVKAKKVAAKPVKRSVKAKIEAIAAEPRTRNRRINIDDIKFVHKNYAKMTAMDVAAARAITLFQVNKIVADLRRNGVEIPKKTILRTGVMKQYMATLSVPKVKKSPVAKKPVKVEATAPA